jgi:hypothetical protein
MPNNVEVLEAWLPTSPALTNSAGNRSPNIYPKVVSQFRVSTNKRYTPRDNNTFCNIFLWDVTAAMGCTIPHWVDPDGIEVAVGKGKELNGNRTCEWLRIHGASNGWRNVTIPEAIANANLGKPTVVVWGNPTGVGHVAVVLLSNGDTPRIAQAGARNFFDEPVQNGFGNRVLMYYAHE